MQKKHLRVVWGPVLQAMAAAPAFVVLAAGAVGCGHLKKAAYEGIGRDDWQKPGQVIEVMGVRPGTVIADIGAGGGYFAARFSKAVGPRGLVYAADVDRDMVIYLGSHMGSDPEYKNVQVILANPTDPLLPGTVDVIFTCNTFHHIENRVRYFADLKKYLRSGGRIVVIDFKKEGFLSGFLGHGSNAEDIRRDLEAAGYVLLSHHDFLEKQDFLIFGMK